MKFICSCVTSSLEGVSMSFLKSEISGIIFDIWLWHEWYSPVLQSSARIDCCVQQKTLQMDIHLWQFLRKWGRDSHVMLLIWHFDSYLNMSQLCAQASWLVSETVRPAGLGMTNSVFVLCFIFWVLFKHSSLQA